MANLWQIAGISYIHKCVPSYMYAAPLLSFKIKICLDAVLTFNLRRRLLWWSAVTHDVITFYILWSLNSTSAAERLDAVLVSFTHWRVATDLFVLVVSSDCFSHAINWFFVSLPVKGKRKLVFDVELKWLHLRLNLNYQKWFFVSFCCLRDF